MVEIREIQKSYGTGKNSHIALKNINLSFRENEFVAILGLLVPEKQRCSMSSAVWITMIPVTW